MDINIVEVVNININLDINTIVIHLINLILHFPPPIPSHHYDLN